MCIFGDGWGRVAVEIEDAGLDAVKVPNHIKVSLVLFSAVTLPRGWQWQLDHRVGGQCPQSGPLPRSPIILHYTSLFEGSSQVLVKGTITRPLFGTGRS